MERKVFLFKIMVVILAIWFILIGCPVVTETKKDDKKDSSDDGDKGSTITVEDISWSKRLGGILLDTGYSITTDTSNNIIVTGNVWGDVDLNGDGDYDDYGETGNWDIIIIKFNTEGSFLWSKRLGGISNDHGYSITTDSSNNIIVIGSISGNADLNGDGDSTDGGAENSTGYGSGDIFISKFNTEGSFLWSKRLGGIGGDMGYSITTDISNNIIVTGYVTGAADLNSDGDSTDGGAESSTGYGSSDIFISKFNSSGGFLWSKRLGGTSNDIGYGITADTNSNIIITGYVTGDADLNGDGDSTDGRAENSTGYGNRDIFISKFDSSGILLWSRRLGGTLQDEGKSVTTDTNNNIIVTGYITGAADLNGDGDSTDSINEGTGYGSSDIFISKFNSSGTFLWSERLGGAGLDKGNNIITDSSSNIIFIGVISGTVDLSGDGISLEDLAEILVYGNEDIFVSKFNSSGLFLWSKRLGGNGHDYGYGITTDTNNNVIVTGSISGNADLNGDGDNTDGRAESSTGYGNDDIFISKFID